MDSEMIWEILKFLNFEYYPADCTILEYGTAFFILKEAVPASNWLGHTQKAGPYSKSWGWIILKIREFQNFPNHFRIHYSQQRIYQSLPVGAHQGFSTELNPQAYPFWIIRILWGCALLISHVSRRNDNDRWLAVPHLYTFFYTLFQKNCKMNSFIFPGAHGQGHASVGHRKNVPWSMVLNDLVLGACSTWPRSHDLDPGVQEE